MKWPHLFATMLCLFVPTSNLLAQDSTAPPPPPVDESPQARDGIEFVWADHPRIRVGNVLRIDLRGRIQTDVRRSEARVRDDDTFASVDLARRRVGIDGELGNVIAFQVERELVNEPGAWRDVYADYRQFAALRVRGGKFKLPFSLEENTSAMNLDFVYRSIATTALAPGRSWGAMAHGRLSERRIEYEAGLFRHDGENARPRGAIERQGAATLAMRVAVEPSAQSKSAARTVRAAVAFTRTDVEATPSTLQLRTVFRSPLLADPIWVNGMRRRIGIETQWMPGPASLKFEYMRATEGRRGQGLLETDVEPLVVAGWYASGTWALTGESKADGLDSPRRPLSGGGIGAIELGARIETLAIGNGGRGAGTASPRSEIILGNQDRVVTLGVNWYVNRWVKVQANVIRESLRDALQGPLPIQQGFWSQALRLQVSI